MSRRTPGEGSISQRKDGLWQASLQVAGVRKVAYAKTEREVRQKLAELRKQAAVQGALPGPGRRTVDDLLDAWLSVSTPNWRPRTLEDRRTLCDVHIRPALGRVRLSKLSPVQIQALYAALQRKGKCRTAQKVHTVLHRACKLATLWGWLPVNPCDRVVRPKHQAERKEVWTPTELRAFLDGAKGHRLYPLWVVALASGARVGELAALAWEDVDWQAGSIRIRRSVQRVGGEWVTQEPKTASSERVLALPSEAMALLKRQRGQQAEWRLRAGAEWAGLDLVFTGETGEPLHRSVICRALQRECRRLGIPELSTHGLRHAHASLLLAEGMPLPAVAQRLGHANTQVTASVYAHAVRREDNAAARAISKVMGGRP